MPSRVRSTSSASWSCLRWWLGHRPRGRRSEVCTVLPDSATFGASPVSLPAACRRSPLRPGGVCAPHNPHPGAGGGPETLPAVALPAHGRLRDFYADAAAVEDAVPGAGCDRPQSITGGAGQEADPVSTALLVVDMPFVDDTPANPASEADHRADRPAGRAGQPRRLAGDLRQRRAPERRPGVRGVRRARRRRQPGRRVIPQLAPVDGDLVVPKRFWLQLHLDRSRRHLPGARDGHLVLVGQHIDCCCCWHTTYNAFLRGIAVTVVSDGTCALHRSADSGAALTGTWRRAAGHDLAGHGPADLRGLSLPR